MRRKLRKPLAILLAFAMVFCVAPNIGFAADNDANSVERVSGHDRYETAANIAEYAFPNGADAVVIANGEPALGYADALAGSFLAGAAEAPILLTQANVLPDATAEAIETLNATRAYVLGGELAVSDAVYSELEALGLEVERVWGQNRYATAVKVYETGAELVGTVNTALIANATRPSDALAAGAYANEANVPVLLVDQDSIHPATEAALAGIENTFVIGGNLVVSDEVVSELDATRVSGRTRNATSVAVAETLWESPENFVLVNGADGIVDALAGSVLGMPILYVPSDDVDAYLDKVITANSRGLILGGVNRISDEFLNEIQQKIEGVEEELQVVSVSAINANTILVTFEGMEPVEITLETPLVHGQTEVTFVYEEVEYTGILDEAYADPEVVEEEIAEAVDAAIAKINAIDNPATLTLEDEAKVVAARTAVDAAIELGAVDADIVNLDHLIAAEAKIKSLKDELDAKETAIQDANVALTNLPLAANITLEDKEQVEAARVLVDEAFNLGAEESDLINLWKLTDAEAKIAELEGEATDAEAVQAVEDAIAALPVEAELTLADKDAVVAARAAYDALTEAQQALVPNVNVLEAAEAKITALEEAAAKEITVKSVSAITPTGITFAFEALTADELGYEATVKDPNGVVIPVVAQDLSTGDTEVVFQFKTAYTSWDVIPSGVWTINGTEYDFAAQLAVKAVNDAGANQVKLLAALQSSYFTNVNADLIAAYDGLLDGSQVTVADVQKAIDDANAANISAAAVTAVNDATNQVELLAALQDGGFLRVNANWIADYASYDTGAPGADYLTAANADAVQDIIDAVNEDAIDDGVAGALIDAEASLTLADITAVENLINTYIKPDTTTPVVVTTKADFLDRVAIHKAVIAVNEATTNNALNSKLTALATAVNNPVTLDIDTVNSVLLPEYRAAIADPTIVSLFATDKVSATGIQTIITAVNTAELAAAIVDVETNFPAPGYAADVNDADNQADALAELNRLADVSADVDKEDINADLIADYIASIASDLAGGPATITGVDSAKAAAIQVLIASANGAVVGDALDAIDLEAKTPSDATGVALLALLKDSDLALTNVVDANALAYLTDAAEIDGAITDTTSVPATDLPALVTAIDTINFVADANAATTASEMQTALTGIAVNEAVTAYVKLPSAAKGEVAELVLAVRDTKPGKVFANLAAVSGEIGTQTTAYSTFLGNVNGAADIDAMMTALDVATFPAYQDLGTVEKVEKAELVFNKLTELKAETPASSFKTIAEIKAAAGL